MKKRGAGFGTRYSGGSRRKIPRYATTQTTKVGYTNERQSNIFAEGSWYADPEGSRFRSRLYTPFSYLSG